MATVGRSAFTTTVQQSFDALRSYDAPKAVQEFAADAVWEDPWHGRIAGKPAIEAMLKAWLGNAKERPSLTIMDLAGDGTLTHLKVSMSGRFGQAPQHVTLTYLVLNGVVKQVQIAAAGSQGGH